MPPYGALVSDAFNSLDKAPEKYEALLVGGPHGPRPELKR
jgi:hypothetical protein